MNMCSLRLTVKEKKLALRESQRVFVFSFSFPSSSAMDKLNDLKVLSLSERISSTGAVVNSVVLRVTEGIKVRNRRGGELVLDSLSSSLSQQEQATLHSRWGSFAPVLCRSCDQQTEFSSSMH